MVEENVLLIKGGRHILYEMANETYVSNDTELRGQHPRPKDEEEERALQPDEPSLVSCNRLSSLWSTIKAKITMPYSEDDYHRGEW